MTTLSSRTRTRRAPLRLRGLALPSLTRRGWAVLAAAAVAVIVALSVGWRDLFYVGLILVGLLVVATVSVRLGSAALEVERGNAPDVVPADEEFMAIITVRNSAWLRTPVQRWRDRTPRGIRAPEPAPLAPLGGRGDTSSETRLSYTTSAEHRGLVEIGPMTVERSDPFGLVVSERTVGGPAPLTVLPRIHPLGIGGIGRSALGDASTVAWRSGHGHDDVVTREYRSGDALRHVNWKASAHRGELMVRQEQSSDEARALVVLDTRRETYPSLAAFEWSVEYAASVLAHLAANHVDVRLLETVPADAAALDEERTVREALVSLASVERRSSRSLGAAYLPRLAAALAVAPSAVHVVLGSATSVEELRELAHQRPHATDATLTMSGSATTELPDEIWFSGWAGLAADPGTDVADAWRRLPGGGA